MSKCAQCGQVGAAYSTIMTGGLGEPKVRSSRRQRDTGISLAVSGSRRLPPANEHEIGEHAPTMTSASDNQADKQLFAVHVGSLRQGRALCLWQRRAAVQSAMR